MERAISIIVADSSEDFRKMISEYLDAEEDMQVVAAVENGREAADCVMKLRPDVLITDLLLREMAGLGLIGLLKENSMLPHTIVVSGFFTDRLAERARELGVERFLPKPCRVGALIEWIRESVRRTSGAAGREETKPPLRSETERLADEVLRKSGIMPHLCGSHYLREALIRISEDDEKLVGVTKVLYPELAEHFGTTADSIERCIRNALDIAWRDGNREKREALFGEERAEQLKKRPGNVRFLKLAHEFMLRSRSSGK